MIGTGFLTAALLEYLGYHRIYIPLKQQPSNDCLEPADPSNSPELFPETCSLPDLHWSLDQERRGRHNAR